MLFTTPVLGDAELHVLDQIADVRAKLRWQLHEPHRWFGSLRRISFARAVQGSNSIEGFEAQLDDAIAVELGEAPLDTDEETTLALKGYRDAMTYVLQLGNEDDFSYSVQLVKSLHFMMTGYHLKNRPGLWRPGAIYVRNDDTAEVVYEGVDLAEVPALVHGLVDGLNEDNETPPLVRAGMAHLNLVMIHPFRDGNGRMARCLQTLVLAREAAMRDPVFGSIEEYLGRNTQSYYDVLKEVGSGNWQPDRDARAWVRFMLTAHLRQGRTVLRRVKESERLWDDLEQLLSPTVLPDRVLPALFDAAIGMRIRNATYRAMWEDELTDQAASRDLRQLVDAGLLVPHGEKRGRHYTGSAMLRTLRQDIIDGRDARDDSDPFRIAT